MVINGSLLKRLRKEKGNAYTQAQVAAELNVPLGTYRCWEQSKNTPDTPMFVKLADYFKVTTDELMGRKPGRNAYPSVSEFINELTLQPECKELEKRCLELNEDGIIELTRYAEYLAAKPEYKKGTENIEDVRIQAG